MAELSSVVEHGRQHLCRGVVVWVAVATSHRWLPGPGRRNGQTASLVSVLDGVTHLDQLDLWQKRNDDA
jgi:hypothetical protein